ncbi:Uncharacterized protein CLAVI_000658 [Candidatus Clavichlamydia salmonicola]|uniref:hypothetical protein n=1 Tax=Candidatus Clavichlamydia salmonicola TaxID=469812 RepID=UPI0018919C0D|nr:hypothetical protein [Candidatus Clavichlamydia salmonicola]MBF5051031.1 Uncharacterized protein [Candidatus Clavichlamydia salmonicola]
MKKGFFVRILICVCGVICFIYNFINQQNIITGIRLEIPILEKELNVLQEENHHLRFMLDKFYNPEHLMMLAELPEFYHLHMVPSNEIIDFSS